jgi:hypothetical protein
MNEVVFKVEEAPEGGYTAKALGVSIFTGADTMADVKTQMKDAVKCHFESAKLPEIIRLVNL